MTSEDLMVDALGEAISRRIGEHRYDLWFAGKTRFRRQDGLLIVGVPNRFYQEWLQRTFTEAVRGAAGDVLGLSLDLRFVIDPELFQYQRQAQQEAGFSEAPVVPKPVPKRPGTGGKRSRRWHRLDDFVVGPCNRLGHAAAVSVVESPGRSANPLVLHGPVGTGKTHLLEGIRTGLHESHPDWDIRCHSAEQFMNRFLPAMKTGQMPSFRKEFRECDALLIDDLHFLARKRVTQEEFVNTFDAVLGEGKQIVVTCDCHPRLAEEFIPELADRLLGGPAWGLELPDPATRLEILRFKAIRCRPLIPDDVLRLLASELAGNVRQLEGALHSLRHFSEVTGRPVDVAQARQVLAELLRHSARLLSLSDIDSAVSSVLQLAPQSLKGKQRAWAVSHPRMLAMYLARKHTAASFSEIGAYFGGRNHSTVVAAEKKVRQWLANDSEMQLGGRRLSVRETIERIERHWQR